MPTIRTLADEIEWLKANPEFEERPATLIEFLGPDYLNIAGGVRESIKRELSEILGHEVSAHNPTKYHLAMFTGAIGIGKTTVASIVLPYLVHWCLCLKNPQEFFRLLPGSRIAMMMMSTSESQAKEVLFSDVKARVNHAPWFKKYPYDPSFKNQLRWGQKDIWVIPGDSRETTFEGYNILGGILDEADSHLITDKKDYAQQGYDTIYNRMTSRFGTKGFLLVIGQMKSATGFAARTYEEMLKRDDAYAVRMTIWESFGREHYADDIGNVKTFFFDSVRKQVIPNKLAGVVANSNVLEIPVVYKDQFLRNPEKALKDLAGIPPAVGDPFIALDYKIREAVDRWIERNGEISPVDETGKLANWFVGLERLPRVAHIDLAYSGDGDALGFAMGHVREMVEVDNELKPYIVIDLLMRVKAPGGSEIFLGDIRRFIYMLRDERKFKLQVVTMDGFESTDTRQQLERKRFYADYVSMDKQLLPYYDLREAIYENRIEIPPYFVRTDRVDGSPIVEIAVKELSELVDNGKKVDHPINGSKDVADAIAGVVFTLMGDRRYHRRSVPAVSAPGGRTPVSSGSPFAHPAYLGDSGLPALPQVTTTGIYQ